MSKVRSIKRKNEKKKITNPILAKLKIPAMAIASLGCGLGEEEIAELEEFRQEALKITPEMLDEMPYGEMEMFSVIASLVQRCINNHNSGRTTQDLGEALEELIGDGINATVPIDQAEKYLKELAKDNRELQVWIHTMEEIERQQGRRSEAIKPASS